MDVAIAKEPQAQSDACASFSEPLIWDEAVNGTQYWPDPKPLALLISG